MQTFRCQRCHQTVFFENTYCGACGARLAFDAASLSMQAFMVEPDGQWMTLNGDVAPWKACANDVWHQACNWAVPHSWGDSYCLSCRMTDVIPALDVPGNLTRWRVLEAAKRHLIFNLLQLGLPLPDRRMRPADGLVFQFKASWPGQPPVVTGHQHGCITISVDEADDVEREARRTRMNEPYRTPLGHLRHEVGHFYWTEIVDRGGWHDAFRQVFGDEREDYASALHRHHEHGPPADWSMRFISAYAASHPWEDWAETFAHYLHIVDALDTAAHWQAAMHPCEHSHGMSATVRFENARPRLRDFREQMFRQWLPLAMFLNSMGRSLGQGDLYPFVLHNPVIDKLSLVHTLVQQVQQTQGQHPAFNHNTSTRRQTWDATHQTTARDPAASFINNHS